MLSGLGVNLIPTFTMGNALTVLALVALAIVWWIRGMPDRRRAGNEADQIKINEAELIRTDYANQIREFRKEVHGYRNDLTKISQELEQTRMVATRRADKLNLVLFILRLVMTELKKLDPTSAVIKQAEALLRQIDIDDANEVSSDALTAAEQSVDAAENTVEKVKEEKRAK